MLSFLAVLLGLSVLCGLPRDVMGSCWLMTLSPSPDGFITIDKKHFANAKLNLYIREEGEIIEMYCGGGFFYTYDSSYHGSTSNTKITLRCESDHYVNEMDNYVTEIYCLNRVSQMFESEIKLPNCENDMTLILGYDFGDFGFLRNAALCFDILGGKLKYLSYTTFPSKNRIINTTQIGQLNQLRLDKNLIRSVDQSDIDSFMSTEKHVASMFARNAFQYASLAQEDQQLDGYEDMLGTVWLRVLRSGNWAHWLSALRVASDAGGHFDVRMGVSGTLQLPVAAVGPCNASRSMVMGLSDGTCLPVPAHIWAHVRALEPTGGAGDGDEFVLIGHNSPFLGSDNLSGLCSSMCDQVPWLKSSLFAILHKFPANGLVQCCRVEDVAQKLDNFPGAFVDATATTAAPVLIPNYNPMITVAYGNFQQEENNEYFVIV